MVVFNNILFYLSSVLFTVIAFCAGLVALMVIRCFKSRDAVVRILRALIVFYGKCIVFGLGKMVAKVRFIDVSDKRRAENPCVYIVNHRAASDAFLMAVLPGEFVQVVNKWPFKLPILGLCAGLAGYISIREMPFETFMLLFKQLVKDQVSVVCFPEGTRSGSSRMLHFHGALFRAAKEEKVSIVPVCIIGNEDKPRRGSLLIKPGTVDVYMLPAVSYSEYGHFSAFALKNYIRRKMQDFIDAHEDSSPTETASTASNSLYSQGMSSASNALKESSS